MLSASSYYLAQENRSAENGLFSPLQVSMHNAPIESASSIAPPPLLYIGSLVIGFLIQAALPQPLFLSAPTRHLLGALLVLASAAFARWAFITMRRVGTSANPRKPSSALATDGPFRLSRNPIYLAMTGLYLGIALLGNSWWPLLLLVPLLLVMHYGVILREERYLATQFGEIYLAYKANSRRWL